MATKKKDGRADNGAADRGLTEVTQIVRGPAELMNAMREDAEKNRRSIVETWRMAAEQYLKGR